MDIKNIKLGIATVAIVVAQAIAVVWTVAGAVAKLNNLQETTTAIKQQQEREAQDDKIWKSKMEAELADLKVRMALAEARINAYRYDQK